MGDMDERRTVANHIFAMVAEYQKHPWMINCGDCEDFATELQERMGDAGDVVWIDELDDPQYSDIEHEYNIAHCVFKLNGFFYDAEEPYGVQDWRHLPLVGRQLRERLYNKAQVDLDNGAAQVE